MTDPKPLSNYFYPLLPTLVVSRENDPSDGLNNSYRCMMMSYVAMLFMNAHYLLLRIRFVCGPIRTVIYDTYMLHIWSYMPYMTYMCHILTHIKCHICCQCHICTYMFHIFATYMHNICCIYATYIRVYALHMRHIRRIYVMYHIWTV